MKTRTESGQKAQNVVAQLFRAMTIEIINQPMIEFIPAQLSDKDDWYVYFYAKDPTTNELKRKRVRINRINPVSMRRKMAKKIIHDINLKLCAGWNPFIEMEAPKSFVKFSEVIDTWMNEKKRECGPDTIRTYQSYAKIFKIWFDANVNKELYVGGFTRQMALSVCFDYHLQTDPL